MAVFNEAYMAEYFTCFDNNASLIFVNDKTVINNPDDLLRDSKIICDINHAWPEIAHKLMDDLDERIKIWYRSEDNGMVSYKYDIDTPEKVLQYGIIDCFDIKKIEWSKSKVFCRIYINGVHHNNEFFSFHTLAIDFNVNRNNGEIGEIRFQLFG